MIRVAAREIRVGGLNPPPKKCVYFSSGEPTSWDSSGWIDYRVLRSWLRHPILTFLWWRQHERA